MTTPDTDALVERVQVGLRHTARAGQMAEAEAALTTLADRVKELEGRAWDRLAAKENARLADRVKEIETALQLSQEGREITEAHLRARIEELERGYVDDLIVVNNALARAERAEARVEELERERDDTHQGWIDRTNRAEAEVQRLTKRLDAVMSMLTAEKPPEEVLAYARALSEEPRTRPPTPDTPEFWGGVFSEEPRKEEKND